MRRATTLPRSAILTLGLVALLLAACSSGSTPSSAPSVSPAAAGPGHPNIVFILTDDLSWNLITPQIAPHITALEKQGETFNHYFVADSLCCPSRSTIFTGLFPHDTKVTTNMAPDGGYAKFQTEGLDHKTFAVALHSAGYATSMMGKYLNGYGDPLNKRTAPVPAGWTDWHVSNNSGYGELNYFLNDNGVFHKNTGPQNYGVDVLNRDTQSFIQRSAHQPFAIEVATFAPHQPFTPAPRNANDFPGLTEPRDPSFNTPNVNPPAWLANRKEIGPKQQANLDSIYRKRAQSVESVDKLLADTEATLAAAHLTKSTYIVFSSDNGYHLGQHRLNRGKQTAFDTDIHVPLIVAGPGVPKGRVVSQVAQNDDLYPTFVQLAGATPAAPIDGHSLVPLLHPATTTPAWRTVALVEHHGDNNNHADPDFENGGSNPTSYEAIRVSAKHLKGFSGPVEAVYVEYADSQHELEYYDINKDPYEIDNIADTLTGAQRSELHSILDALQNCHSASACWSAAQPQ
ncbi:MAG TPA: sulfatase [Frankiaceae bacterium]|nr:sulfatase [Frankiaceae bacterium]